MTENGKMDWLDIEHLCKMSKRDEVDIQVTVRGDEYEISVSPAYPRTYKSETTEGRTPRVVLDNEFIGVER